MSKSFGGKDPFDDPFFTQPFGGRNPFDDPFLAAGFDSGTGPKKEISIEELDSTDDTQKSSMQGKEMVLKKPNNSANGEPSFSFQRVSYGGVNGIYYSSSIGRRTGGDGVALVEIKEEDKTVGQTFHTTSRGIHGKGHSVTTKHNSDGLMDSLQILHNLGEDELAGFEEDWKVNADRHLAGWNNGFNLLEDAGAFSNGWDKLSSWSGWAFPSTEWSGTAGAMEPDGEARAAPSTGRPKKVVPINVE